MELQQMTGGDDHNNNNNNNNKKRKEGEEHGLECPRCHSTNTKFGYFKNHSMAQPRHFCKNCRRHWTHGGSLRSIAIAGASQFYTNTNITTPPNATAMAILGNPTPPIAATMDSIRHFGTQISFPAASISLCDPNPPPYVIFHESIDHDTNDVHSGAQLPLFHSFKDEFPTSKIVGTHDHLVLAWEANCSSTLSQNCNVDSERSHADTTGERHYKVDNEPSHGDTSSVTHCKAENEQRHADTTTEAPIYNSNNGGEEYVFDSYDDVGYCYDDLWVMPTELQFHK